jgi:hypothetical protein
MKAGASCFELVPCWHGGDDFQRFGHTCPAAFGLVVDRTNQAPPYLYGVTYTRYINPWLALRGSVGIIQCV